MSIQTSKTSNLSAGFTTIEIMVAIGLLVMMLGLGLFLSMDIYRGSSFAAERDILISILQKARNQSVNNINGAPHGTYVDSDGYKLFQGPSYAGATEVLTFPRDPKMTISGDTEFVFDQLTGDTTAGTISLTGQGKTIDIVINSEGRISW